MEWTRANPLWSALGKTTYMQMRTSLPHANRISFEPRDGVGQRSSSSSKSDKFFLTLDDAHQNGQLSELGQVFFEKLLASFDLTKSDIVCITIVGHEPPYVDVFLESTVTEQRRCKTLTWHFIPMNLNSVLDFIGIHGQLLSASRLFVLAQ